MARRHISKFLRLQGEGRIAKPLYPVLTIFASGTLPMRRHQIRSSNLASMTPALSCCRDQGATPRLRKHLKLRVPSLPRSPQTLRLLLHLPIPRFHLRTFLLSHKLPVPRPRPHRPLLYPKGMWEQAMQQYLHRRLQRKPQR